MYVYVYIYMYDTYIYRHEYEYAYVNNNLCQLIYKELGFVQGHWNHNVAVGLPIAVYGTSD